MHMNSYENIHNKENGKKSYNTNRKKSLSQQIKSKEELQANIMYKYETTRSQSKIFVNSPIDSAKRPLNQFKISHKKFGETFSVNNASNYSEAFKPIDKESLNYLEEFYQGLKNNEIKDSNSFFKRFKEEELYKTFRELNLEKETYQKMIEKIEIFIKYGLKYLDVLALQQSMSTSTDITALIKTKTNFFNNFKEKS